MRLSFLLMMTFLVSVFHANCQSDDLSIKDAKSLADQLVLKKDYLSAAKHYEHAFNKKTSDLMSAYQAGKYFLLARDYLNAAKNLRHVSNSKLKGIYDARFLYAKALKSQENYVNAAIEFKKFASEYLQEDFEEVFKKTELELTGCEDAMNEKDGDVSYRKYTFKTDNNDISPRRVNNKIYLTSGNKPIVSDYKFLEEKAFEESLFSHLNCKAFSGSMAFKESGDELFFTSCSDSTLTSDCIILQSILVDGQWSSPVPLAAYINAAATASKDPFVVNRDGVDILYFSSNRSGGKGGFDIWYSVRNNGSQDFSIPTNAGMINTSGDELSPSYNKTASDLYFSSNGHPSSGGFDIFKVTGDKNTWAAFTHLTAPFNSGADDTYPFYDHDGNIMFSSNRSTTSKESTIHDDIYFYLVNNPTPIAQNVASSNVVPKLKDDEISSLPKKEEVVKESSLIESKKVVVAPIDTIVKKDVPKTISQTLEEDLGLVEVNDKNYDNKRIEESFEMESYNVTAAIEAKLKADQAFALENDKVVLEEKTNVEKKDSINLPKAEIASKPTDGNIYSIQIGAVAEYKARKFEKAAEIYPVTTETFGQLTRVTLKDIGNQSSSTVILEKLKSVGFADAFMYRIVNGERIYQQNPNF